VALQRCPQDLVGWAFPGGTFERSAPQEVVSAQMTADGVLLGSLHGVPCVFQFEFEAEPSSASASEVARRAVGLFCAFGLPVRTTIVYLHPSADGRRPRATARIDVGERPVSLTFRSIALWRDVRAETCSIAEGSGSYPSCRSRQEVTTSASSSVP
jgi:hypothetical protein